MRRDSKQAFLVSCLLVALVSLSTASVQAQELLDAHRDWIHAQQQLRQYRYVSFPQQRRSLDEEIRLTEAEIGVLRRRVKSYREFLLAGEYSALFATAENYRLELLATEQQLRRLKDDRINLWRTSRQTYKLYKLEAARAAMRLAAVRNGGVGPLRQVNSDGAAR